MAGLSFVFGFLLCVFAVKAFPSARRSDPENAYVVYRMPSRCVEAPKNDICDIGYKIRNFGDENFDEIVSPFSAVKSIYNDLFPEPDAQCPSLVMKLLCQNSFPECLPGGRVNYGDRDKVIAEIEEECTRKYDEDICKNLVVRFRNQMKTGIHKDPLASYYTLNCTQAPQDPEKKCPQPQYAMPAANVNDYYERIRNVMRDMEKEKDEIPDECYKMGFNVFGCSYAFCSADRMSVLMKTTEQDCRAVEDCMEENGALNEKMKKFFDETCPKYNPPAMPDDHEEVDLH